MTEKEALCWVVGIVEGEGCFTLHSKYHPYFLLDMCDLDVLERVKQVFPFVNLRGPYHNKKKPENKARYRIDAFGPKAVQIMEALYPFLLKRRQQKIEELLHIWRTNPNV